MRNVWANLRFGEGLGLSGELEEDQQSLERKYFWNRFRLKIFGEIWCVRDFDIFWRAQVELKLNKFWNNNLPFFRRLCSSISSFTEFWGCWLVSFNISNVPWFLFLTAKGRIDWILAFSGLSWSFHRNLKNLMKIKLQKEYIEGSERSKKENYELSSFFAFLSILIILIQKFSVPI